MFGHVCGKIGVRAVAIVKKSFIKISYVLSDSWAMAIAYHLVFRQLDC